MNTFHMATSSDNALWPCASPQEPKDDARVVGPVSVGHAQPAYQFNLILDGPILVSTILRNMKCHSHFSIVGPELELGTRI